MQRPRTVQLCLCALLILAFAHRVQAQTAPAPPSTSTPPDDTTTVTVQGKKTAVTRKIDRTVYDQSNNPQAQSGTAADVLKTVPAVTVSPEGDVALRGNKDVQVYINGKPSAMMQGDSRAVTLLSMNGSDIATVEIITNPSAAYNANGGGIINIVLKKNRKPGFHGLARLNQSSHGLFNSNVSGTYTRNRLTLTATVGIRRDGALRDDTADLTWRDPSTGLSGRSVQATRALVRRASQSATLGLDYDLSDRDTLSLSASLAQRHSANPLNEYHQDYDADGVLTGDFDRTSTGPGYQSDLTLNTTFIHRAIRGDELKLQAQHSQTVNGRDKTYRNLFAYPVQPATQDRILTKSGRRLDDISGDYVRPLGDTAQVSTGFDVQSQTDSFYNYTAVIDPASGAETVNPATTNRYAIEQTLAAAYLTWQGQSGKWTTLAGLRLETIRAQAESHAPHSYANLNPSLHLSFAFDDVRQLKASFSQSLQRPDPRDLNPFTLYVDAQNITAGNPDLKPQGVRSLELEYDVTRDPLSWAATLYYRTSARTVTDYSYFVSDTVLLTTKRNSGRGRSGGVDLSVNGKLGQRLSYDADLNLFYAELQASDLTGPLHQSGLSYTGQVNLSYAPDDADTLNLDSQFGGRSLTSQGSRSGTNAVNLSWRHQVTPRLTLFISAKDVLKGSRQSFRRDTATVHQTGSTDFQSRWVFIGASWKLGT